VTEFLHGFSDVSLRGVHDSMIRDWEMKRVTKS